MVEYTPNRCRGVFRRWLLAAVSDAMLSPKSDQGVLCPGMAREPYPALCVSQQDLSFVSVTPWGAWA